MQVLAQVEGPCGVVLQAARDSRLSDRTKAWGLLPRLVGFSHSSRMQSSILYALDTVDDINPALPIIRSIP